MLTDPAKREPLPVVMPLRRVNAQYVSTGFEQCRDPLLIVAGVDSRTNNIAFVIVQQFIGVLLMALIVLAEDKTAQTPVLRENGERVELMLPDNVVGFFERRALTCPDEFSRSVLSGWRFESLCTKPAL